MELDVRHLILRQTNEDTLPNIVSYDEKHLVLNKQKTRKFPTMEVTGSADGRFEIRHQNP